MTNARRFASVLGLTASALLACNVLAPTASAPPVAATATTTAALSTPPNVETSPLPVTQPRAETATAEATVVLVPTATPVPLPTSTPTAAPLQLEVVLSQTWTDRQENVRVNFLLRNPYDFPVRPTFRGHATARDKDGKLIRDMELYFLDGISGGSGFLLPGETIAANACFTCETTPLPEALASVSFSAAIADASGQWNYSQDVEAAGVVVTFEGDSPIFWVTGKVKNKSASALSVIAVRVIVYDKDGQLAGAATVSAYDVGPGATGQLNGYGIGQKPAAPARYEISALGVSY